MTFFRLQNLFGDSSSSGTGGETSERPSLFNGLKSHDVHSVWNRLTNGFDTAERYIPNLKLTDLVQHEGRLTDSSATNQDRLQSAKELFDCGKRNISFRDANGKEHNYQITESTKNGITSLNVFEKDASGKLSRILSGIVDGMGNIYAGDDTAYGEGELSQNRTRRKLPHRPQGLNYGYRDYGSCGRYCEPDRGERLDPAQVDSRVWQGVRHGDGSVAISFKGCQVDTDGSGAHRHPEDKTRQFQTSLRLSNGESLDTDKDNFFVLPKSVARAYGIQKGDLGWLVGKDGKAVPVVFGDVGPEGKLGEASVKALKDLGYTDVNGARGVSGDPFKIVFVPGSGDGTGDIARNPAAMAAKLAKLNVAVGETQLS